MNAWWSLSDTSCQILITPWVVSFMLQSLRRAAEAPTPVSLVSSVLWTVGFAGTEVHALCPDLLVQLCLKLKDTLTCYWLLLWHHSDSVVKQQDAVGWHHRACHLCGPPGGSTVEAAVSATNVPMSAIRQMVLGCVSVRSHQATNIRPKRPTKWVPRTLAHGTHTLSRRRLVYIMYCLLAARSTSLSCMLGDTQNNFQSKFSLEAEAKSLH